MAVVHVTNWSEFKSAIATAGNTVIVDNNIDANGTYTTSTLTLAALSIQGNGYTIYNIMGSTTIFGGTNANSHSITDLNFANCDTSAASSSTVGALFRASSASYPVNLTRCNIQGNLRYVGIGYVRLSSCAIVMAGSSHAGIVNNTTGSTGCYFESCYVDLGESYKLTGDALFGYCYMYNCYFKGKLILTASKNINGNYGSDNNYNNVYNMYVSSDSETARTLRINGQTGGSAVSIINADRIDDNITLANNTGVVELTDAQMKDASYISSTGFPIIV